MYKAVQPKSISAAGEEFLIELLRYFANDQPDVLESEFEAEDP